MTHITRRVAMSLFASTSMASFSILILLSCLFIHIQILNSNNWISYAAEGNLPVILSIFQGTLFLLYPFSGWLAEVFFTNFRMIKWSFFVMLISSVASIVTCLLLILDRKTILVYGTSSTVIAIITGLIGFGMYESNAVQFGMDQMLEASSEQLSSFIHWYFWCVNVGPLFIYYVILSVYLVFTKCIMEVDQIDNDISYLFGGVFVPVFCVQLVLSLCGIIFMFLIPRWFNINQVSKKPLKIFFGVLNYSLKHKYPERRSAFTYWENDIPPRIDLGKEKYGGPFTYEQVEDVKSMLRLLLLIVSLFGYHLLGDGYSLNYYIISTMGCPALAPSLLMTINPQHITVLVVVLAIPLYQFIKRYLSRYNPSLLKKLFFGLLLCLFSECIQCNLSLLLPKREFRCPGLHLINFKNKPSLLMHCIVTHIKIVNNGSCEQICFTHPHPGDSFLYLSAIPLVLNGVIYLLVFVTTVEFICAQSPNAMKGLLIGVWYSMQFIKYSVVNNLDIHPITLHMDNWSIYHGIKGLCIFLSIVSFSLVHKCYQYRERDEIVNEQAMIEEQYERELLLNSSHSLE